MKKRKLYQTLKKQLLLLSVLITVFSTKVLAQLEIDVDVSKKEWYEEPWAWIVGAAVFILLLALILRGGRKR